MCSGRSRSYTPQAVSGISRYLFDSLHKVGWCNKVMNIMGYMLPDMLSLSSQVFLIKTLRMNNIML